MGFGSVCLIACATVFAVPDVTGDSPHSKASAYLYQPPTGEATYLAFRLEMEPKWHSYWKNPGDSGMPISVDWQVPEGVELGEPQWPAPARIVADGMITYGYEDDVALFYPIKSGADKIDADVIAKGSWLICNDMCLPANASPKLSTPSEADLKVLHAQFARVPKQAENRGVAHVKDGAIRTSLLLGQGPFEGVYAFVEEEAVVAHSKPQKAVHRGAELDLELPLSPYASELPSQVHLVVVGTKAGKPFAYRFSVSMQSTMEEQS